MLQCSRCVQNSVKNASNILSWSMCQITTLTCQEGSYFIWHVISIISFLEREIHICFQIVSFLFDIHDINSYIANYNNSWTETFQRITIFTYSPPRPFLDMSSFLMLMLFYENH